MQHTPAHAPRHAAKVLFPRLCRPWYQLQGWLLSRPLPVVLAHSYLDAGCHTSLLLLVDSLALLGCAFFYCFLSLVERWLGPFSPSVGFPASLFNILFGVCSLAPLLNSKVTGTTTCPSYPGSEHLKSPQGHSTPPQATLLY